jgi:hypothetical protein
MPDIISDLRKAVALLGGAKAILDTGVMEIGGRPFWEWDSTMENDLPYAQAVTLLVNNAQELLTLIPPPITVTRSQLLSAIAEILPELKGAESASLLMAATAAAARCFERRMTGYSVDVLRAGLRELSATGAIEDSPDPTLPPGVVEMGIG